MVYVDSITAYPAEMVKGAARKHGVRWCHMWASDAESLEELHRIAAAIGMRRDWFQDRAGFPHYDLVPQIRADALEAGAVEMELKTWIEGLRPKKKTRENAEQPTSNSERKKLVERVYVPETPADRLRVMFRRRCFTVNEGLNWLQERGFISDLCVSAEDVAPVDVERVEERFFACWGGGR